MIVVQELHAVQTADLRKLAQEGHEFQCHVWPINQPGETWFRLVLRFPGVPRDVPLLNGKAKPRRWKQITALTRFLIEAIGDHMALEEDRVLQLHLLKIDPHTLRSRGE